MGSLATERDGPCRIDFSGDRSACAPGSGRGGVDRMSWQKGACTNGARSDRTGRGSRIEEALAVVAAEGRQDCDPRAKARGRLNAFINIMTAIVRILSRRQLRGGITQKDSIMLWQRLNRNGLLVCTVGMLLAL